jgi:hypothetical protein
MRNILIIILILITSGLYGADDIIFGYEAGKGTPSDNYNITIGYQSGTDSAYDENNINIGNNLNDSLIDLTNGIAIGYNNIREPQEFDNPISIGYSNQFNITSYRTITIGNRWFNYGQINKYANSEPERNRITNQNFACSNAIAIGFDNRLNFNNRAYVRMAGNKNGIYFGHESGMNEMVDHYPMNNAIGAGIFSDFTDQNENPPQAKPNYFTFMIGGEAAKYQVNGPTNLCYAIGLGRGAFYRSRLNTDYSSPNRECSQIGIGSWSGFRGAFKTSVTLTGDKFSDYFVAGLNTNHSYIGHGHKKYYDFNAYRDDDGSSYTKTFSFTEYLTNQVNDVHYFIDNDPNTNYFWPPGFTNNYWTSFTSGYTDAEDPSYQNTNINGELIFFYYGNGSSNGWYVYQGYPTNLIAYHPLNNKRSLDSKLDDEWESFDLVYTNLSRVDFIRPVRGWIPFKTNEFIHPTSPVKFYGGLYLSNYEGRVTSGNINLIPADENYPRGVAYLAYSGAGSQNADFQEWWIIHYITTNEFLNQPDAFNRFTKFVLRGDLGGGAVDKRWHLIRDSGQYWVSEEKVISDFSEITDFNNNPDEQWAPFTITTNNWRVYTSALTYQTKSFTNIQGIGFISQKTEGNALNFDISDIIYEDSPQYYGNRGTSGRINQLEEDEFLISPQNNFVEDDIIITHLDGNFIVDGTTNVHFWVQTSTDEQFSVTNGSIRSNIETQNFEYIDLTDYSFADFTTNGLSVDDQDAEVGLVICTWDRGLRETKYFIRAAMETNNPPTWSNPIWKFNEVEMTK